MNNAANNDIKRIGIVGGGKIGLNLYQLFSGSSLTRVAYVIDINQSAPAVAAAKKDLVPTYQDVKDARSIPVDFIFEVTGREDVVKSIYEIDASMASRLVTHEMARVILEVIEENDRKVKSASISEISEIKTEISQHLGKLGGMVEDIEEITSGVNILAINARIEAARVGEQGRGFGVVATEMGKSAGSIRKITEQIEQINKAIAATSDKIDAALKRLE
jgi:methyl-accepting chemotaxis protein